MKQKTGRKLLSFLLTLVMVLSQMPGMSLTVKADNTTFNPASSYTGFSTLASGDDTVKIDGVKYDSTNVADWYVLGYDDTSKTITLLSKQSFASKKFNSSDSNLGNAYASSEIKTYVEGLIGEGQPLAGIKDALADISGKVTGDPDTISGAVPYLLSYAEANALSTTKKLGDGWWLRSPGKSGDYYAAFAFNGSADEQGYYVGHDNAVRPALQLNLSSVTFSSDTNTFTVGSATVDVTGVSLDKTTAQTIEVNGKVSFTATVAPDNATDKKVKWSVGGTNSGAVKLYSDEACTTEVGTDATETLTVYAKGISAGSATVTATSNADSTKTASCAVTVNEAAGEKAYAAYDVTTETNKTKSGNDLTALQLTFNERQWYIIEDNSSGATSGTVTLLSADTSFGTEKFNDNENSGNAYSGSIVKTYLDNLTGTGGSFASVADAIETVNVKGSDSDSEVDVKLWLLSKSEANSLPEAVRKCSTANGYANGYAWWLRSPGGSDYHAAFVDGGDGDVYDYGLLDGAFGVRPALKLDLSKVTFDSASNTFAVAAAALDPVSYQEATVDETTHAVTYTGKSCTDYEAVTSSTTTFDNGKWYVVKPGDSAVEIASRITVNGTANLILCDGATLTAIKGIEVAAGSTLNIYAQSEDADMGALTATGGKYQAGIGGGSTDSTAASGTINIHGGNVTATGKTGGAGIGGGTNGSGGSITIYGGTVTAQGRASNATATDNKGAGIGSGYGAPNASTNSVTIYGGTVTATGGINSAGIGGGQGSSGAEVIIYGGTVTASGGPEESGKGPTVGIGAGYYKSEISNGTLTLGEGVRMQVSTNNSAWDPYDGNTRQRYMKSEYAPHTHEFTYTLTIPSTLTVANSGWNATDGISATGTLAEGKKLTVSASSGGEFALVSGENKVNYKLAASGDANTTYANATEKTTWEFTALSETETTQTMGIIVDDYSDKPAGTYQDTVTFTASVVSAS